MGAEINTLIDLLNEEELTGDTSNSIFGIIDSAYNTLSSPADISTSIFDGLSETGKSHFFAIWALAGLELAYHWIETGFNDWDDRKKASEIYAYKNLNSIESLFEKYSNVKLSVSIETADTFSRKRFYEWCRSKLKAQTGENEQNKYEWILSFAHNFSTMHPTLKQSYFGGALKGVINPILNFEDNNFPFI